MAKYNVGDKVRIVSERGSHWNDEGKMDKWFGKVMTIRSFDGDDYKMEEDKAEYSGGGWYWKEEDFVEKVDETPETPKTKFKVGDKIIGNEKAKSYGVTTTGWEGIVIEVTDRYFKAKGKGGSYGYLNYDKFDLLEETPEKKPKERDFKVGDRVKAVKPVGGDRKTGVFGKIIEASPKGNRYLVEFDDNIGGHDGNGNQKDGYAWYCDKREIKLVKEESKYYNGKIMCVDTRGCNETHYTKGKIYEVVDGSFITDDGKETHDFMDKRFKTFKEWENFTSSKFTEVKDEETPTKLDFYEGKVVCVANHYEDYLPLDGFTVGKVYTVTDGVITRDNGKLSIFPALNLDMLCAIHGTTFVPLVM